MQSADNPEFSSKFTVDLISFISASFGNDIDALSSGSIVYSLKSGISEIFLEKFVLISEELSFIFLKFAKPKFNNS